MKFVLIKRYRNRKFYNTETKRYITLTGIKQLITDNREVRVIDNSTGTDITSVTLSQIVYEIGKRQTGIFPAQLLSDLVQLAGRSIKGIHQEFYSRFTSVLAHDIEIERRVILLIERGELTRDAGTNILDKLVYTCRQLSESGDTPAASFIDLIREMQIPTQKDLNNLIKKVDDLSQRLETYRASAQAFHEP